MKILIIGSGGREHALAWKFKQSKQVSQIYVIPGSSGMNDVATSINIDPTDFNQLVDFAKKKLINLTVVGPEVPLVQGIVDVFQSEGLTVFGPTKKAAQIEGSKQFAKDLMRKYNIPTAEYEVFTDYQTALSYVQKKGVPIVIKADGLAAGKGVVIARDIETARHALDDFLNQNKFGNKVVIEEYLDGEEFSLMAFVKEKSIYPMDLAQDYKRVHNDDLGPNTGGMGAYSPVNQISDEVMKDAIDSILIPTTKAMVLEGCPFTGVLYAGLILTKSGPKVIEFNARFGDPETEVILPRLKNDLFILMMDLLNGKEISLEWDTFATIGVVLASNGYPEAYEKGFEIDGLNDLEDVLVFHMGTSSLDKVYTNGGRVLIIVSRDKMLIEAKRKVYREIKKINCNNLFYRTDIGMRSI